MATRILLLFLAFGLAIGALSRASTPPKNSLLENPPQTAQTGEIVRLRPIPKHHFNREAPSACGEQKPLSLSESEMRCRFQSPGRYTLRAGICDERKTFCKIERLSLEVLPATPSR